MRPRQLFAGVSMDAVQSIAVLFETEAERQPFDLPGDEIGTWLITYRAESGNVRVLLWPAIDRIDISVGPHMWVVKGIREIEVIDGLEFIAKFGQDGLITVARSGHVILTTTTPTQ